MKKIHSNRFVNRFPGLIFILFLGSTIVACAPEEDGVAKGPKFLFFANNGPQGREPWVSNGTAAGTKGIKDIVANATSSVAGSGLMGSTKIVYMGGKAFFAANDGSGEELWVSNGTPGGTQQVTNIYPATGSEPKYITVFNGWLYFSASDGTTSGRELWRSDGVVVGGTTERAADIVSGPTGSDPKYLTVMDGVLYFSANTASDGRELWSHNSVIDNATDVLNINPAAASSDPKYLAVLGSKLYFSADDGTNGRELWCYLCEPTPSAPFEDIISGPVGSDPQYLTVFNDKLYFSADGGVEGRELWVSSGAASNANQVDDINPLVASSEPRSLIIFNNELYFGAKDGTGADLWKMSVAEATQKIQDIETVGVNTTVADMKVFQGRLYFVADNTANGRELWVSDGSSANLFKDINGGVGSAFEIIE